MPEGGPLGFPPEDFFGAPHPWSGKERWRGHGVLQLQRPGEMHAVWVFWQGPERELGAWYVNIQEPFRRSSIGFDTQDLELDIVDLAGRLGGAGRTTRSWRAGSSEGAGRPRRSRRSARRGSGSPRSSKRAAAGGATTGRRGSPIRPGPSPSSRPAGTARRDGRGLARRPSRARLARGGLPDRRGDAGAARALVPARRRRRGCRSTPPAHGSASRATSGSSRTPATTTTRSASRGRDAPHSIYLLYRDGALRALVRQLRAPAAAHADRRRHVRREARPARLPGRPPRVEGRGRARAGGRARPARRAQPCARRRSVCCAEWPFPTGWEDWRPDPAWPVPQLPAGWDVV